jgi:hypothetical protein
VKVRLQATGGVIVDYYLQSVGKQEGAKATVMWGGWGLGWVGVGVGVGVGVRVGVAGRSEAYKALLGCPSHAGDDVL